MTPSPRLTVSLLCGACFALGILVGPLAWRGLGPGPPRGPGRGGPPPDPADMLRERLDLDDAQTEAVREVFSRYHPQFEAVEQRRREALSGLRDQADAELRQVLDDEQFAKLLELRRQIEAHDRRGPGGPGSPPPSATPGGG